MNTFGNKKNNNSHQRNTSQKKESQIVSRVTLVVALIITICYTILVRLSLQYIVSHFSSVDVELPYLTRFLISPYFYFATGVFMVLLILKERWIKSTTVTTIINIAIICFLALTMLNSFLSLFFTVE